MLDNKGFDLWSKEYDKTVKLSEEKGEYPFDGYRKTLSRVYSIVRNSKAKKILDIGIGTGILSKKLYDEYYLITGIDFSKNMLDISRKKMEKAVLIEHDFSKGLPIEIKKEKYDAIISTYSFHHIKAENKNEFISSLKKRLNKNGFIIIGDIAFISRKEHDICREKYIDIWDDDEDYLCFEEIENKDMIFEKISQCAGVIVLANK